MKKRLSIKEKVEELRKRGPKEVEYYMGQKQKPPPGTDVTFIVQSVYFHAHKKLLIASSVVFTAMFSGHFKESKVSHPKIEIDDISPSIFKIFLDLIYFGLRKLMMTIKTDDALGVYYVARKYCITQEKQFLKMAIRRNLNAENVLLILPSAEFYGWEFIRSKCWSIIERDTKKVVESKDFSNVSWNTLHLILENSRLTISEYDLFRGITKWVEASQKLNPGQTAVDILGTLIYKIHFPIMTKSEFGLVKLSGFLRPGEIDDLTSNFRKNTTFPNKPRHNRCQCQNFKTKCLLCNLRRDFTSTTPNPFHYEKFGQLDVSFPYFCECFKYKSCSNYPNGETVNMFRKLMHWLTVNCNYSSHEQMWYVKIYIPTPLVETIIISRQ